MYKKINIFEPLPKTNIKYFIRLEATIETRKMECKQLGSDLGHQYIYFIRKIVKRKHNKIFKKMIFINLINNSYTISYKLFNILKLYMGILNYASILNYTF